MKVRPSHIAIVVVAGLLLASGLGGLLLAVWFHWQIDGTGGWRDEVYELVGMTATTQASDDYRDGHLRLYTLGGESDMPHYTGTNDGPFEVWIPQFYPSLGRAHKYAKEQFIEFYNRRMRYMHAHPEKFQRSANGSHAIRTETNSTPSAAGTRAGERAIARSFGVNP